MRALSVAVLARLKSILVAAAAAVDELFARLILTVEVPLIDVRCTRPGPGRQPTHVCSQTQYLRFYIGCNTFFL